MDEKKKEIETMAKSNALYSDNARAVLTFLQENPNVDMTAKDLAEAIGLNSRVVNGTVTGLSRKGIAVRDEVEVDGKAVKYIHLTEAGRAADPLAKKPVE